MTPDEIDWQKVADDRFLLERHLNDLDEQRKQAKAALAALPKRPIGRTPGIRLQTDKVWHNYCATRLAFDMIQKWRHIEKKKGRLKRTNALPPDGPNRPRTKIIEAACAKWPKASREQVRDRINRVNKHSAVIAAVYDGRGRDDPKWLDRSDDYLDV